MWKWGTSGRLGFAKRESPEFEGNAGEIEVRRAEQREGFELFWRLDRHMVGSSAKRKRDHAEPHQHVPDDPAFRVSPNLQ